MLRSRRIDWRCDLCGEPIADGEGRAFVNEPDVSEVQRAKADFEREHKHATLNVYLYSAADLADLPQPARWEFRHHACDPAARRSDYWLDIETVRTEAAVLVVTANLMGKSWLGATNWDDVITGVGKAGSDPLGDAGRAG